MKAAIVAIGTELLMGETVNTNASWLSGKLNELGIDVIYHHTVGDNPDRLERILKESLLDCDLIITTGGLGPTQDDMTKDTVCKVFEDKLVKSEFWMDLLREKYYKNGRKMTPNNERQAMLPSRGEILINDAGTAPGFLLRDPDEKKQIICMPGPPREMQQMFEQKARPNLDNKSDGVLVARMLRTFGIGESNMETALMDLIENQTDPTIATYAKPGECSLRIASKRKTRKEAEEAVDKLVEIVRGRIGEYVYSYDDEELAQVVARKLIDKRITLSAAESCTAGLFAATLAEIPGISACLDRSLVTYSDKAKIEELGVKEKTLEEFGAVSEETALEMAEGVKRISGSDIGISVTGIAGPGGESVDKPVGLVYIGFVYGDIRICCKSSWNMRDRNRNRRYFVLNMLDIVRRNT